MVTHLLDYVLELAEPGEFVASLTTPLLFSCSKIDFPVRDG